MNRRRETRRTLTGSRIYVRKGSFAYFSPEPIVNTKNGRATKWHTLCPVADGEEKAREILSALLRPIGSTEEDAKPGNFGVWFGKWKTVVLQKRQRIEPKDPVRLEIWKKGTKSLLSQFGVIENGFVSFDVGQPTPVDVATFLDQWEGRRAAQAYRAHLSKFFAWCCRKGLRDTNPAREVEVETPQKRDVYITDDQYKAIQVAALIGKDKKPTRTGEMLNLYMDLLYLFYQRGTEIRLLRWDQIGEGYIQFKPTKTERSSGAKVKVMIGPDAAATLSRLKQIRKMRSMYVIHTEHGQPYSAHGIGSQFERACDRAGIDGVTLKDIRAKAATDAHDQGYSDKQIQIAFAHGDVGTTQGYIRSRAVPVSDVILSLPKK